MNNSATPAATTPYLIIVIGLPGAGKTHFARQFARQFAMPFIDVDELFLRLPTHASQDSALLQELHTGVALYLGEMMKTQKTLIFEGGADRPNERANLIKLARSNGYRPLLVWVQTDKPTRQYRQRELAKTFANYTVLAAYRESVFSPPRNNEVCTVISGKHTFTTQSHKVLQKLQNVKAAPERTDKSTKKPTRPPAKPATRASGLAMAPQVIRPTVAGSVSRLAIVNKTKSSVQNKPTMHHKQPQKPLRSQKTVTRRTSGPSMTQVTDLLAPRERHHTVQRRHNTRPTTPISRRIDL